MISFWDMVPAAPPSLVGAALSWGELNLFIVILHRSDPDAWVGKTVQVEGSVADVCPKRGCWMDLKSGASTVRVKVDDGVIVFPKELIGRTAVAEGVFTRIELDREEAIAWFRHVAEEKGEPFDPASVAGPASLYQLRGTGALAR